MTLLQNRLNSIFHDFAPPTSVASEPLAAGNFVPAVDVYEDAQKVVVKLEVPGVREEDLDVRIEDHTLTVKGERKFEAEEKEENFHRIERRFGSFFRSFTVSQAVDTDSITANYDAGVLTVKLAKKAETKPKQIKIALGSAAQPKKVEGPAA